MGKRERILAALKENWEKAKAGPAPTPDFFYRAVKVGAKDKIRWASEAIDDLNVRNDVAKRLDANRAADRVDKAVAQQQLEMIWNSYNFKLAQYAGLATTFEELSGLEVMTDTGRGAMLLAEAQQLKQDATAQVVHREKAKALADRFEEADEDSEEYDKLVRDYWIYNGKVQKRIPEFGKRMDKLEEVAEKVLEFEAVKAWVSNKKNADASDAGLEAVLVVAKNGIKAVEFGADKAGMIPEHHTQAAKAILKIICSAADAGLSLVAKQAKSANNDRKVKKYLEEKGRAGIVAELNKDPLLIAQMLAEKRIANVELALDLIRPLVVTVSQLAIGVETLYGEIHRVVLAAVRAYQDERLRLAKKLAGEVDDDEANPLKTFAEKFFEDAGTALVKRIKDNVFSVLDPAKLAKDVVADTLAARIAAMIVKSLPVDPAQPFSGDQLTAELRQIKVGRFKDNPFVKVA